MLQDSSLIFSPVPNMLFSFCDRLLFYLNLNPSETSLGYSTGEGNLLAYILMVYHLLWLACEFPSEAL